MPSSISVVPDAKFLLHNAEVLTQAGDFDLAKKIYDHLSITSDCPAWVHFRYGLFYEGQKKWQQAIEQYQKSIAFEPSLDGSQRLAGVYLRQSANLLAAKTLERALGLAPDKKVRFELLKSIGNCYFRCQQVSLSEKFYQLALQINASADDVRANIGFLQLKNQHPSVAKHMFQDALACNPNNYQALSGLALCYYMQSEWGAAHEYFSKSLKMHLNNPTAIFYLVKCAFTIKSFSVAEDFLKRYIEQHFSNPDLQYSLASLQLHLGKFDQMSHTLDTVLSMDPSHTASIELKNRAQKFMSP